MDWKSVAGKRNSTGVPKRRKGSKTLLDARFLLALLATHESKPDEQPNTPPVAGEDKP